MALLQLVRERFVWWIWKSWTWWACRGEEYWRGKGNVAKGRSLSFKDTILFRRSGFLRFERCRSFDDLLSEGVVTIKNLSDVSRVGISKHGEFDHAALN